MIRFALDLELEQFPRNSEFENRIIQIGAVKFDSKTGKVLDEFCAYINMHKPLSDFIKELTGVTDQDLQGGTDFLTAYRRLVEWTKDCSTHQAVVWGGGDMWALRKTLLSVAPGEPWAFGYRELDVKALYQAYAEAKGNSLRGGLEKALKKCGMSFDGRAHDAVVDAKNTAKFYCWFVDKFKSL